MTQETVRDIAAANPAAVRVFEKYGIDYCCGGHRPLAEVCTERGIAADTVLAEVEAGSRGQAPDRDWMTARLTELIGHIVSRHHRYLNTELPALEVRLAKVVEVHGAKHPEVLGPLHSVFASLKDELEAHLQKEEMVLFPAIEELEAASTAGRRPHLPPFGTVRNPIRMMEHEHDGAGQALRTMRDLTGGYQPPADACTTYPALYTGLEELEKDLHTHIHLENNILFPRAVALESRA
ncbi:MAG: iron-sulfur cluster repair di-iron protein [Bryobacteraceae bacterium]|jgi:regulator of cell morphogenesis and NO signaling